MARKRIADLRSSLGLTQHQLAEMLGAHEMTVSKWERGVARPPAFQAQMLGAFERAVASDKCHVVSIVEGMHKRIQKGNLMGAIGLLLCRGSGRA